LLPGEYKMDDFLKFLHACHEPPYEAAPSNLILAYLQTVAGLLAENPPSQRSRRRGNSPRPRR
jgi:hypothetical protein